MKIFLMVFFMSFQIWGLGDFLYDTIANGEQFRLSRPNTNRFITGELKEGKLFLKIPLNLLDKPMLFVNHHDGYKHISKQVVWTKFQNQLMLESPRITSETGTIIPIDNDASILKNTLAILPIIVEKSNSNYFYVEATKLVLGNSLDWEPNFKELLTQNLSYIKGVEHLDGEIIIKTNRVTKGNKFKRTAQGDFSFYLLPSPMKPRLFDYRMGFFSAEKNANIYRGMSSPLASISRWRLKTKNTNIALSVPVKPITFILSASVPKKWRPYVRLGILEWLPAFEAAGFKNALTVEEIPIDYKGVTKNSVNHSMVRWGHKRGVIGFEDNGGSTVSTIEDLRSGEILKADILIGTSLQALSDEYFVRCAPLDKRAQQYPFPDDLMGKLIQRLVAHETGHALGILDAEFGEYAYPFEKMRDKMWLLAMGYTPSIMSYTRHNYIVQPEDGIDPDLLIQKVGPMDLYNIQWAYTPFDDNETEQLESLIRLQDSIPWFRYVDGKYEIKGPGMTNEVVDNRDPINSTIMGLKNIERVLALLPKINEDKKDFALLERLYSKTLDLWYHQMRHVMSLIGGYEIQYKSGGQPGSIYTPILDDIQTEAMDFLFLHAFNPPQWLVNPAFLKRIKYSTYPDKILELQFKLLFELLGPQRMKRFEFMEKNYTNKKLSEVFLSKLQRTLFDGPQEESFEMDNRRRELQILYITQLQNYIKQERKEINAERNDFNYTQTSKALFFNSLQFLKEWVNLSKQKKMDNVDKAHLNLLMMKLNSSN